jgi:hypothetical protein
MEKSKGQTVSNKAMNAYLQEIKTLVIELIERDTLFTECCPTLRYIPETDKKENLSKIAKKTKEISERVQRLLQMENGTFGVTALLQGQHIPEETALVLYCCIAARLDQSLATTFRRVQDFVSIVAGRDGGLALKCRNLFRSDSPIDKLIALGSGCVVLDEKKCFLRETAFNKAVNQTDDRTTVQCEAELFCDKWDRR